MNTTKHIWLVTGNCGEYSDRTEWPVMAFENEADAQEHARLASNRANELSARYESRWEIPEKANEYDPGMQTDYTGTSYHVSLVELRAALAKAQPQKET